MGELRRLLRPRASCVGGASAIALVLVSLACQSPGQGMHAYVGSTAWTGLDRPPVTDAVILVDGDSILDIGPASGVEIPKGAEVRDLAGRWIIPGLIDTHVHLERWMLAEMVANGITTVRDVGGHPDSVLELRSAMALGGTIGPRMFVSGAIIDRTPAQIPNAEGVASGTQARRAIDQRVLAEVSLAAISPRIGLSLLRPLLHEASVLRLPVSAHLGQVDAVTAAREGVRSIEHLSGVPEAILTGAGLAQAWSDYYRGWRAFLLAWARIGPAALTSMAQTLAGESVVMVPTLVNQEAIANLRNRGYLGESIRSAVPEDTWDTNGFARQLGLGTGDFAGIQRGLASQARFVRAFVEAGGLVTAGSNAPSPLVVPGFALHRELEMLVEAGLSTSDALLAATRNASILLGIDSLGVLRPGVPADFLVIRGDPLESIANTRDIELVIFRGTPRTPDQIRQPSVQPTTP